jgi:hypothetical protein
MEDLFDDGLLRALLRMVLGLLRALLFIGWDLLFEQVGWFVGWFFYRVISFGRFPEQQLSEQDRASTGTAILVEFTGLGLLALAIYGLSQMLGVGGP